MKRATVGLMAPVLGLLFVAAGVPAAQAAGTSGCSGTVCVDLAASSSATTVKDGESVDLTYTITVPSDLATATFTETNDAHLVPVTDANSVAVDGAGQPATATSSGFTVDLGALTAGTHTITFAADVHGWASADADVFTSSGSLAFSAPGQAAATSTASVDLDVYGGEWQMGATSGAAPFNVADNGGVSFHLSVSHNTGYDSDAELLAVDVPPGLVGDGVQLFEVDASSYPAKLGGELACVQADTPAHRLCELPLVDLGRSADLELFIPADDSQPRGTAADINLFVTPLYGVDPEADGSADQVAVTFVGASDVEYTFEPAVDSVDIPVGETVEYDLHITNHGPDPSPVELARIETVPASDGVGAPFSPKVTGPGVFGGAPVGWRGELAAGQTVTLHVAIKANVADKTGVLRVVDGTYTPSPDCFDTIDDCATAAELALKSIAGPDHGDGPFFSPKVSNLTDASGNTLTGMPTLSPGQVLKVGLAGFAPHAKISVTLHSTTRDLGTITADADGRATYTLTVPADLETGEHTLTFAGTRGSGSGVVAVKFVVAEKTLASTGTVPAGALIGGLASLVLGAGLLFASRRRRRVLGD